MQFGDPPKHKKLNPRRAKVKLLPPMNTARKTGGQTKGRNKGTTKKENRKIRKSEEDIKTLSA